MGRKVTIKDSLQILLSFDGRISRKTFWLASLAIAAISVVFSFVGMGLDTLLQTPVITHLSFFAGLGPIEVTLSFVALYPVFAVLVKRLHDRNKGARWLVLLIIPILGSIWLLIEAGFLRGTSGSNDWGDDPLRGPDAGAVTEAGE